MIDYVYSSRKLKKKSRFCLEVRGGWEEEGWGRGQIWPKQCMHI
jgi:hypothetical protein